MPKNRSSQNRALEKTLRRKNLFPNTSATWQQSIINNLLLQIKIAPVSTCIDAACGVGNNIYTLKKYFHKIIAFDKSAQAIEFARKRHHKYMQIVSFTVGDLEYISYYDNSFDCVVCTEALEHVINYTRVIKQLYRITKPNGYVIMSFQNHFNFSGLWKYLFEKIYKKNWDVWGTHRHETNYESYLNIFQVKQVLNDMGFIFIKEFGADYLNAWFFWLPFIYRNYKILNRYPWLYLGKLHVIKYFGMDYFLLLKKP